VESLDKVNKEFFWKKSNIEKSVPLIDWDKIYIPKKDRGLGLKKIGVNKVFITKLIWKFFSKSGLNRCELNIITPQQFFYIKKEPYNSWV